MPADKHSSFGAAQAASYAGRPARLVPGFDSLHRMTSQLLAERVPEAGRVLVLGAGGGLELQFLAQNHPGWRFDGVDPSAEMLSLAAQITQDHRARINLHQGYVDAAPPGPFDGAVCLLTLHFVPPDQRGPTLRQLRARLVPGAPLVVAHLSYSQTEPERSLWIARHLAFGGTPAQDAAAADEAIRTRLSILSPEEDEASLRAAGFSDVTLFYAGLSFRGWVSTA